MVEIKVTTNSLTNMFFTPKLDGIGPAYCSPLEIINSAIKMIKEIK